jgi:hypothetical protein
MMTGAIEMCHFHVASSLIFRIEIRITVAPLTLIVNLETTVETLVYKMATNAFAMMMGESRKRFQEPKVIEALQIAPVKKKQGRPPAIRKFIDLTPLMISLGRIRIKGGRKSYDSGDEKLRMDIAFTLLIRSPTSSDYKV